MGAVFLVQTSTRMRFLLGGQERRSLDGVGKTKVAQCANDHRDETLDDQNPAPAGQISSMANRVEASSKQSTESTRERSGGIEDSDTEGKFGAPIEMRKI